MNLDGKYDLNFYPNPTTGLLYLQGKLNRSYVLKIYTLDGIMLKDELISVDDEIDISNLPSGLFIYYIIDDNTVITIGKLTKIEN